jgi:4-amino-4-deoxy-L-arabinose transferase-like glycosyltransferase
MSRRQQFCAAFGLAAVAAILRMGLAGNQPLWSDEIWSLATATGHSLDHPAAIANPALGDFVQPDLPVAAEELRRYIKHDNPPAGLGRIARAALLSDTHPPLYYFLLYGWTLAFGTSDFILRAFSTICSLACFPFVAGIARRTAGSKAVVPACLLFAFSPLGICFSTEGRMYSLLWLCVLAVTWLSLVWCVRGGGILLAAAWIATSAAGFLTHYFFVFPWSALVVFLLLRPQKVPRIRLVTCILLTSLTIFPWYMRLPESLRGSRLMKDWLKFEPDGFNRLNAAASLVLQNFSGAGHHESSNFVALVIFAIIGAAMAWRLRLQMFGRRRLLLWLLFVAPCAGVLAFDLVMRTYTVAHERYAIAALPIACLLAGAGLAALTSGTRTVLLVLILVAWAPNLLIYDQTGKRFTHRNRAEAVSAKESPTDLILIDAIPSGLLNLVRYLKGPAPIVNWMPSWLQEPAARRPPETIRAIAAGRTRIWWVAGAGSPPSAPEREWLRANAVVFHETRVISDFRPKDAATF